MKILPEIIREILEEIELSKAQIKVTMEKAKMRKKVTMKVHPLKVTRRRMKVQKKKRVQLLNQK
eukprot:3379798-Ditylum_brightwellii.AAC.1